MIKVYTILTIIFISTLNFNCSSHRQSKINAENNQDSNSLKETKEKKGAIGIGYGYGKGMGSKSVDSLIKSLSDTTIKFTKGGALNGKRPRKEIMKTIMTYLASIRNVYNKRLREKPDLKGRVTFKILVLESGYIHECSIESSTVKDRKFEKALLNKIKAWNFGKIDIPGDTTEIIYPFVFTR